MASAAQAAPLPGGYDVSNRTRAVLFSVTACVVASSRAQRRVLLQSAKACGEMEDGALEPRLRIGAKASHWRRDFTLWRRGCQCALWLTLVL